MKSIENKGALVIDLFFCLALMPSLLLLGPAHYWIEPSTAFFAIVTGYLYLCYFVLRWLNIPRLFIERRYLRIVMMVAAMLVSTYVLTLYPLPGLDFVLPSLSAYQTSIRDWGVALSVWLMFTIVAGYALTTSFVLALYAQLLQKRRAELAVFKAQISPHFLFNTLNSLYGLVVGTSQKAEEAFVKFTEILRYTYTAIDRETVRLGDEISYISNYIDLQQIRLDGHTTVVCGIDVDDDSRTLPPMLMLTFVENAFKYGASTTEDCTITINLQLADGRLRFETVNRVMRHSGEFRRELPKGLENCRARPAGMYPGRHSLETRESDGLFTVLMTIDLD